MAADLDLARFFDSVNFDVCMRRVAARVSDQQVLRLIWRYLRAGVVEEGKWSPAEEGVPQGGPLSPLLANIVLHDLDMELEQRGHKFVRYADELTRAPPGALAPAGRSPGDRPSRAVPGPRLLVLVGRQGRRRMCYPTSRKATSDRLETVATLSQTGARTAQAGGLAKLCHPYGAEPQELLAHACPT